MNKQKMKSPGKHKRHWTDRSVDDFVYKISADFVRQLERAMITKGTNQAKLAKRLKVSEGRVSQVLNNPGNLTLKKIVEYVRALGCKVAIVEYDDDDPENRNGPVNAEIFAACWRKAGMPNDFFSLEDGASNDLVYISSERSYQKLTLPILKKATNERFANDSSEATATTTSQLRIQPIGVG